jgi:4-hydroxy-2-oxoheptanedioate aldolase
MSVRRTGLLASACLLASFMVAWPHAQQAPAGAAAPGQAGRQGGAAQPAAGGGGGGITGPNGSFGTLTPWVPDAARPIGFRVRQELDNPSAKLYNTAKQKLLDGQQVFSWTASRPDPEQYCMMAPHYDFTWIEMQHSTLWYSDVEKMIAACPRVGVPIIRVPDGAEGNIQKATDIGALGVNVPTVDDAIEARDAGRFSKFPPLGRRSSGSGQAGSIWGVNGINYRNTINDNMLTILMIETPEGATNAYEIASQPGVDVVIIGNGDLASFSGYPATDPHYQDLAIKIHDGVLKAGKFFGCASNAYATGTPISKDARLFQNGRSNDGFQPPARGAAAPAPGGAAPAAPAGGRPGGAAPGAGGRQGAPAPTGR